MMEPGTILDGKYEIIRLLGEGGMGTVYEVRHTLIARRFAAKFLHPQYITSEEVVTRFQREAQAAAAIGHENIIEVTDMGSGKDKAPYIVMEFLDGRDVGQLLEAEGVVHYSRAAHIMVQALSALQAAHDAHIIHRDLKPENIYLITKATKNDYVKLLDFGISKFRALETDDAKGLTQTGTVLGTPYYMSPEQARGDQDLGPKSDVYAMGVILYQMLSGNLPFDAPNYNALLIKILTEDPVPIDELCPDVPVEVTNAVKIAMARDAQDRFESCIEFRHHLLPFVPGSSSNFEAALSAASHSAVQAALSSSTPLEMTRTGLASVTQKPKTPFVVGGIAIAVVTAGIVGFVLFGPSEHPPQISADASEDQQKKVELAVPPTLADTDSETLEEPAAKDTEQVEQAAVQEKVTVKISASPINAVIAIDDLKREGNPFEEQFDKDDVIHKIEIKSDGYATKLIEVKFDENVDRIINLELKKRDRRHIKPNRPRTKPNKPASAQKPRDNRRKIDDEDPWQ